MTTAEHKRTTWNLVQWIAALKSGKYSKTTGVLRDSVGYCCLGVATELKGCLFKAGMSPDNYFFEDPVEEDEAVIKTELPSNEWFIKTFGMSLIDLEIPQTKFSRPPNSPDVDPLYPIDITEINDHTSATLPDIGDLLFETYRDRIHRFYPQWDPDKDPVPAPDKAFDYELIE